MRSIHHYYRNDIDNLINFIAPHKSKRVIIKESDDAHPLKSIKKAEYVFLRNTIGNLKDIQTYLSKLSTIIPQNARIVIIYFNHFWEPIIRVATALGWRKAKEQQNWLDGDDIQNLLTLSGFEVITSQKRMLLPVDIPIISTLFNKYLAFLPFINSLCLTTYVIAKPKTKSKKGYSISIVVPARNEAGNINKIVKNMPRLAKKQEIIFVEGHSQDDTWKQIADISKNYQKKGLIIKAYKQRGKGKADAVRLGFKKANGDILMIYDADMTVDHEDLVKFYNALASGAGEFINGSRLVYPMEADAMRFLNIIGNKIFSIIFTWIFGQRFTDTLCGTKAFFKNDYLKFKHYKYDPFGDFELIFGAIENNLKVVELPIRYKERVYGTTNISRFQHGLLLVRMAWRGFKKFRAY